MWEKFHELQSQMKRSKMSSLPVLVGSVETSLYQRNDLKDKDTGFCSLAEVRIYWMYEWLSSAAVRTAKSVILSGMFNAQIQHCNKSYFPCFEGN